MNGRSCRYTVLHHTGIDEPHFDFLFETSDTSQLVTFRLRSWPVFQNEPMTRLRDHRRAYLDYVGPVSGDRGRVDRVDDGRMIVVQITGSYLLKHEDGMPYARLEEITGGELDEWVFIPFVIHQREASRGLGFVNLFPVVELSDRLALSSGGGIDVGNRMRLAMAV